MYLTKRDREILLFIEKYKSITIKQCSKIFYTNNKYAYYQSRKRLKLLCDNKLLKRYREDMRSETIYYSDKKLSYHDTKVIDVYAELVSKGCTIKDFKQEYIIPINTDNGKDKEYRADGLIEFEYQGYFYPLLIEIDYTHFTGEKKLMDIYNSGYFQNKYKDMDTDIFPTVIIARPVCPCVDVSIYPFILIYVNMCIDIDINNII